MKRTNGSGSVQQLPSGRWRVRLMLALVASVVLSGQHVELAIQVAEGGPFRWRRATELAVRVISTGAALKEAAG